MGLREDWNNGEAEHLHAFARFGVRCGDWRGCSAVQCGVTSEVLVLVADDEAALRSTLSAILETAGHRIVEAEDGQVALRQLREREFDVLVLDLHMPNVDGRAVLQQICVPPPVVIIYSAFAFGSLDEVRDELGAKVFRFMRKPVPPLELIAAVNEAAAELSR